MHPKPIIDSLVLKSDSLVLKGQISVQTTSAEIGTDKIEPAIIAAVIIAGTTLITVALGFWIKDYWIPNRLENNKKSREEHSLFNRYKTNLISSVCVLAHRLSEMKDSP